MGSLETLSRLETVFSLTWSWSWGLHYCLGLDHHCLCLALTCLGLVLTHNASCITHDPLAFVPPRCKYLALPLIPTIPHHTEHVSPSTRPLPVHMSVSFWSFLSVTFGIWLWDVHSMCVNVLCCQRNIACCVIISGFGRRWSVLLHIYQTNCGQETAMLSVVISLQTAAQKAIFSMQPRRSTKRVSWSRVPVCQHRSIFASCSSTVHVGVHGTVSCRTALIRRLWTFYVWTLTDWCANASGPRSFFYLGH